MSCGYDRMQVFVSGFIDKTTQTCALCGELHSAHKKGSSLPFKESLTGSVFQPLIPTPAPFEEIPTTTLLHTDFKAAKGGKKLSVKWTYETKEAVTLQIALNSS